MCHVVLDDRESSGWRTAPVITQRDFVTIPWFIESEGFKRLLLRELLLRDLSNLP
jgi:hypothetical protein